MMIKSGVIFFFIGFIAFCDCQIVSGGSESFVECPRDNYEYKECGRCDPTCENPDPVCNSACESGCFCKSGYVMDSNRNCITLSQCRSACPGENQEYKECGGCEPTCGNQSPICAAVCQSGCYCKSGFVKDATGKCIERSRCQVTNTTKTDYEIYFKYYYGKTLNDYVNKKWDQSSTFLQMDTFRVQYPTIIYIHGYKENANSDSVKTVINTYLKYNSNQNTLLLDWSSMADGSYHLKAAPNTKIVAKVVADELKKLIMNGLPSNNIHLVGHSLGAHVAGFIGRYLQEYNIKLKRITGLDPSFHMFYPGLIWGNICETDAEFVDIIHTNPGIYGAPSKTGTVDFWVNPLTLVQPGCKIGIFAQYSADDLCSHWRSWKYWAESLENPRNFPALKANNGIDYLMRVQRGEKTPSTYMGIAVDTRAKGDYYLKTNSVWPYGTGKI